MCSRCDLGITLVDIVATGLLGQELDYTFDVITNEKLIVTIYGHENFDVRFEALIGGLG